MSFSRRILYFLVHRLRIGNKAARLLLEQGRVEINGTVTLSNELLEEEAEVKLDGQLLRPRKKYVYLKFNKPVGYQSTLNPKVNNHLAGFFTGFDALFIAGRLDQQSDGLLLLSNNGKWVETLCNPASEKEKEYRVILDRAPDTDFAEAFSKGVHIGNYLTRPCVCKLNGGNSITVVLTEGKNRQIRRMCRTLGYAVASLQRLRIAGFELGKLAPGELETISPENVYN